MKRVMNWIGRLLQKWSNRPVLHQVHLVDETGTCRQVAQRYFLRRPHQKGEKLAWISEMTHRSPLHGAQVKDFVAKGEKGFVRLRGVKGNCDPVSLTVAK